MTWAKPSDAAAEAAVWGLIESEAKKRKDEARQWLTERMGPDLLAVAAVTNGMKVGKASYVEPRAAFKVTNDRAFLEFVRESYPTELVESPNPAWLKGYLDTLKQAPVEDDPWAFVIVDGNGLVVAGVETVYGSPYVSVTKSKDARETVAQMLSSGGLSLDGIKELGA